MEAPKFSRKSNDNSDNPSWLALDLPMVSESNQPLDHPTPSADLVIAHAMELIRSMTEKDWEKRRPMMNPERFCL